MELERGAPDELVLMIVGLDLAMLDAPACSDRVEAAGGTVRLEAAGGTVRVDATGLEVRLAVLAHSAPISARS